MFTPQPIGYIRSAYQSTQQVPKGLGATHDAEGTIEILPQFEAGLADIEGFSHLIVLWVFDRVEGFDLTAAPPCDDRTHGVFATRSPLRPNPIGLTTVELLRRDGSVLHVRGLDMLDGTPVLDLKPYLSSIPAEKLRRGWLAEVESPARQAELKASDVSVQFASSCSHRKTCDSVPGARFECGLVRCQASMGAASHGRIAARNIQRGSQLLERPAFYDSFAFANR